jgi:hypothetical protein
LHKLESARNALQETAAVWDRKIREAEAAAARHLEDLRAAHCRESEAFEADWSDPDFLLAFRKPSPVLLQLREIERAQGLTKAFADAENTRKRASGQEREEFARATERANAAMRAQYQAMQERHARELLCVETRNREIIEQLQRERGIAVESCKVYIAALEGKLPAERTIAECVRKRPTRALPSGEKIRDLRVRPLLPVPTIQGSARRKCS